jgi:hypothetical protein
VASWRDAVQAVPGGTRILVEAHPGAKDERFPDGFNEWREGRIGVRVKAPAQEGAANEAVLRAVAGFFGVAGSKLTLESGATDRRKTLVVALPEHQVLARLATVLP